MQFRQIKPKLNSFPLFVTLMCLFMVWSCVPSEDHASGTSALSFHVVYHDRIDGNLRSETAKIDCSGQGITDVVAKVFDSDNKHLVSGGPWDCDDGQGKIVDVPVGRDRTVVVLAMDADGNIMLSGQVSGIAVNAGSDNNAVTIDCYDFLLDPADDAVVKQNAVVLQWQEVTGAAEYRVLVSQNSDMSDPVIEDSSDTANDAPSGLIPMTTYYWQIVADDIDGNVWIASQIRSFTVAGVLPDTGQTYSDTETFGEDSDYTINPPAYTMLDASGNVLPDSADDWAMVRDDITGLTWEAKTTHDDIHNVEDTYTWQGAQDNFIAQLNDNNFGGYSDWRLPTIKELYAIVHKDGNSPAVNSDYFPNIKFSSESGYVYWSSTAYVDDSDDAWFVNFRNGDIYRSDKNNTYFVLAVRGGQHSNSTLVDNGDGTVTDTATGLMWQQDGAADMPWEEALTYCEDLVLAEHDDWRLPNINELQSIVDYNAYRPSINTAIFTYTESLSYWSSTTYVPDIQNNQHTAWNILFSNGDIRYYDQQINPDKSNNHYVRAVRGGQ